MSPPAVPQSAGPAPNPVWTFITTSPLDNGVNDVMSGFLQGLGHVEKPPEMSGNTNYNRGYFAGAIVNVGSKLVPIRAITKSRPGEFETPARPRTSTTQSVPLPPRGLWNAKEAEALLEGSWGEVHVPPEGASLEEARQFAQARGNPVNTTWATHAEGVKDLQGALNQLRGHIDRLRPGEQATWVASTAQRRTGLESQAGGGPVRFSFSRVEITLQKTVDGGSLQLLHFMPKQ